MAAYAALVSLMRLLGKLHLHPHPPISLNKIQVESLTEKISFLQDFLEAYNPHLGYSTEADPLESRIADATYAAEDLIESHIVDHITNKNISSDGLYEGLEKVMQDLASIQKEAMDFRETTMELQHQPHSNSRPPLSFRSSFIERNSSMVGVDDVLLEIKDKLTSHCPHLRIIPIVGMGGTGKTTLVTNIYQDPLIQGHFHVYAWATISQEYSIPQIFSQILLKLKNKNVGQQLSEDDLGDKLRKYLFGRKYLIVMDDMWNIEAWEKVRRYFPDNENGSRIVITTRLSNLASEITGSSSLEMKLLDGDSSWNLLSKTVFGENDCPLELEEMGKKIARSCKGLPLSIVVVGGILARSEHTREYWESIKENLFPIVSLVEDGSCLRILHMSYRHLPVYLKPCFLYMGIFPEDAVICVSKLTKLWVAEGFLKPRNGISFEETAKEYLSDLVSRNLILIHKLGSTGSIKECKIHDLLRDLCIREAEKERFYIVSRQHGAGLISQRRIVISNAAHKQDIEALQSTSLARSLIWGLDKETPPSLNLRLLRIFEFSRVQQKQENMFLPVNLRYIATGIPSWKEKSLSSINRIWGLETLIVTEHPYFTLPDEIWYMPQIRHVVFRGVHLPDPPSTGGQNDDIVLENLHTLKRVVNLKFSEEVVKRINPNIKKLQIVYYNAQEGRPCLNNLVCLHKLESLDCFYFPQINPDFDFPQSIKKLKLSITHSQSWQGLLEKIGNLPLLEKLILMNGCFEECRWETAEAQFQRLKHLQLLHCCNLKQWILEGSHFPRLEHLVLEGLHALEEIPLDVAEIPTLGTIELKDCSASAAISTQRIVEEQEETDGVAAIHVRVITWGNSQGVESLASHNIRVEILNL